jgi:hypothetical protein
LTRAPTKDRLNGKVMGGNPVFRGTRVGLDTGNESWRFKHRA